MAVPARSRLYKWRMRRPKAIAAEEAPSHCVVPTKRGRASHGRSAVPARACLGDPSFAVLHVPVNVCMGGAVDRSGPSLGCARAMREPQDAGMTGVGEKAVVELHEADAGAGRQRAVRFGVGTDQDLPNWLWCMDPTRSRRVSFAAPTRPAAAAKASQACWLAASRSSDAATAAGAAAAAAAAAAAGAGTGVG
jgi:hypothetical protein